MLASDPVPTLNQKKADLGIPRDSLKPHPALDREGELAERETSPRGEQRGASDEKFGVSAPSITLPKGGGAISGIGEKSAANPVTRTGAMAVPVFTSPGCSGFGPQLSLSYDSGAGNGPFGFGRNLSVPSITRRTDKGLPKYFDAEESDIFILSGAEDLVPVLVNHNGRWERQPFDSPASEPGYVVQRYRPRIEGLFARVERWTDKTTGISHWRSKSRLRENEACWDQTSDRRSVPVLGPSTPTS